MKRSYTAVATAALMLVASGGSGAGAPGRPVAVPRSVNSIVSAEVEFRVDNVNRSGVPCSSDEREYSIRGWLEAPMSALAGPGRTVTLYLHSPVLSSRASWRFDDVAGYDHSWEMALRGHASVTIDRLGYGESDIPPGAATCYGAAADVAAQVVQSLRDGTYTSVDVSPVPFDRVAVAGFSGGGLISEIAAYAFGGIDALVVVGWAEGGHDPGFALAAAPDLLPCATGGQEKRAGEASGYVPLFSDEDDFNRWLFADTDPEVLAAARKAHERDPCGELASIPQVLLAGNARLNEVRSPVLLVFGEHDAVYPGSAPDDHRARFTGSQDVTLIRIADAGHTVMLERGAVEFRSALSTWLEARGF